MPNPLEKVSPSATVADGFEASERNPELAALVLGIISEVARIDNLRGRVFAMATGDDMVFALEKVSGVKAEGAKKAVRDAVMKIALSAKAFQKFEDLEKLAEPIKKTRDKFAHGIWADSEDVEDALLLCDPRVAIVLGPGLSANAMTQLPGYKLPDAVVVYRRNELEKWLLEAQSVCEQYVKFRAYVAESIEARSGN